MCNVHARVCVLIIRAQFHGKLNTSPSTFGSFNSSSHIRANGVNKRQRNGREKKTTTQKPHEKPLARKNRLRFVECHPDSCRSVVPTVLAVLRHATGPIACALFAIVRHTVCVSTVCAFFATIRMHTACGPLIRNMCILTANHTAFQIHHVADTVRTDDRCPLHADFVQNANSLRRSWCDANDECAIVEHRPEQISNVKRHARTNGHGH